MSQRTIHRRPHLILHIFTLLLAWLIVIGCGAAAEDNSEVTLAELLPAQSPAAPVLNTAHQPPAPDSPLPTPVPKQMTVYRGLTAYNHASEFEVEYDASVWRYIEPEQEYDSPRLEHRLIDECSFGWPGGGVGASPVGMTHLAGRVWDIYYLSSGIDYSWYGNNAWYLFNVTLPEPYTPDAKSPCQLAAEEIIDTFRPISTQPESLLVLVPTPTPLPPLTSTPDDLATWPVYTFAQAGASFRYPPGWRVVEQSHGFGLTIRPPSGAQFEAISFRYLSFEKPEEINLADWLNTYFDLGLSPVAMPGREAWSPVILNTSSTTLIEQHLHFAEIPPTWEQGFYITQGRIVYRLSTWSQSAEQIARLYGVAESLQFAETAPTTLRDLDPAYTGYGSFYTIEEYLARQKEEEKIGLAVNLHLQTGKQPTYLLNTMADWAVEAYEARVARQPGYGVQHPIVDPFTQSCLNVQGAYFVSAHLAGNLGVWYWQGLNTWEVGPAGGRHLLSPDQRLLAYYPIGQYGTIHIYNITCPQQGSLAVLHPDVFAALPAGDSGGAVRLNQFDWLPDSRGLLFNTGLVDYYPQLTDDLYRFDLESGEITQLFGPGEGGLFEFSPDRTMLALSTPNRVRLLDAETLQVLNKFSHHSVMVYSSYNYYPGVTWLADGSGLAVVIPPREGWLLPNGVERTDDGLTRVWRMAADGTPPQEIAAIDNRGPYFLVSPDLQHIVYATDYTFREPLYQFDHDLITVELHHYRLATGEDTLLYAGSEPNVFSWLPNQAAFILHTPYADSQFRVADLTTGELLPWPFEFAPDPQDWIDNRRFLYTQGAELWMGDLDGGKTWLHKARGAIGDLWLVPTENNPVIPPP